MKTSKLMIAALAVVTVGNLFGDALTRPQKVKTCNGLSTSMAKLATSKNKFAAKIGTWGSNTLFKLAICPAVLEKAAATAIQQTGTQNIVDQVNAMSNDADKMCSDLVPFLVANLRGVTSNLSGVAKELASFILDTAEDLNTELMADPTVKETCATSVDQKLHPDLYK